MPNMAAATEARDCLAAQEVRMLAQNLWRERLCHQLSGPVTRYLPNGAKRLAAASFLGCGRLS